MNPKIIVFLIVSLVFGGLTYTSFKDIQQGPDVKRLTKENHDLANQYHQLVKDHKALNRAYVEKHGYIESETTTNGELFIIPYHSDSTTKIKVHTPAMVKIEYQQQDIKHQFDKNNDTITDENGQPMILSLKNRDEAEIAYTQNMTLYLRILQPWVFLIATIVASVITIIAAIRHPKA